MRDSFDVENRLVHLQSRPEVTLYSRVGTPARRCHVLAFFCGCALRWEETVAKRQVVLWRWWSGGETTRLSAARRIS